MGEVESTKDVEQEEKQKSANEEILESVLDNNGRAALKDLNEGYTQLLVAAISSDRNGFLKAVNANRGKISNGEQNLRDVMNEFASVSPKTGDNDHMYPETRKMWQAYENEAKQILHLMEKLGERVGYPVSKGKSTFAKTSCASFSGSVLWQSSVLYKKANQFALEKTIGRAKKLMMGD